MNWFTKIIGGLFGSNDKGIVTEVSDTVDKWIPSETSKHNMSIEDQKAGDESQDSARKMELPTHNTWFDSLIDGINRLPRPVMTTWAFGILVGWWPAPVVGAIDPMTWNIIWTIVTFWFGSRMLFKDIPAAFRLIRGMVKK